MTGACRRLWAVDYTTCGKDSNETLLIVAQNAELAARKAKRFLRDRGDVRIEITSVKNDGIIDVL